MYDPEAARRLAAAAIICAIKDAKGRNGGDRVEAIAWLASKDATKYLDVLDMPQSSLLTRCGWMDWAEEVMPVLEGLPFIANEDVINTICRTFTYLLELKESQHAETSPSV